MSKFIKSKNELILGIVGILLLAALIAIFVWGISFLAMGIGKSISSGDKSDASANFDLEAAKQLHLKGLAQ